MTDDARATKIADTVYRDLRRLILRGEIKAGERLPGERELAQRFRTNRNTLREAVRRLEQARLVMVRHGQGVTVADFRHTGSLELLSPFLEAAPDPDEVALLLADILPARLMVIEVATREACRRAGKSDLERLRDLTELLVNACAGGDPVVIARGFHRWLDALVDGSQSLAIRWIANPLLDAYRELLDRFPSLWIVDPAFPEHLHALLRAISAGNEERAISELRSYYRRIDARFGAVLEGMLSKRKPPRRERAGTKAAPRSRGRRAVRG